MNKESKLNLNAGNYAIRHCVIDKTYNGLEVHKMLCDAYIAGNNDTLEDDDERIKNSLINLIKMSNEVGGLALHKWEADEMLAWIKKQGEHANFRNNIQVGDKVTRNEAGVLVNLSQLNRVAKKNEKQGEKKPADKVEPKFKVGDWVVSPNGVYWHIDSIQNGRYEVTADTGQRGNWPLDTNIYHLWSIKDSKNGDILKEDSCTFIIERMKSNSIAKTHFCLFDDGCFDLNVSLSFDVNSTYPATKEQCEVLFQKMKEANCAWDTENKKVRIIKQENNL